VLCCTTLYCTAQHCTVLYGTAQHCTVLYYTAQNSTALYFTVLYCTHQCTAVFFTCSLSLCLFLSTSIISRARQNRENSDFRSSPFNGFLVFPVIKLLFFPAGEIAAFPIDFRCFILLSKSAEIL
jgi:hypothetical protein